MKTFHKIKIDILLLMLMLVSSTAQVASRENKLLQVMILYESLCPDSVNFFQKQLSPSYHLLKDYIDIVMVPFGKSQSFNNGANFICQHGPNECEGNRVQSCVLRQTENQEAQVNFGICQMRFSAEKSGKECSRLAGIFADIDECMKTEIGTVLQLEAEAITNTFQPKFVPTIIYDQNFDQELQDNSLSDFKGVVCSILKRKLLQADSNLESKCSGY